MHIDGNTELIAHIGYPTHSFKAPMIYNPYFKHIGANARVVPFGCKVEDFADVLRATFRLTNIRGQMITVINLPKVVGCNPTKGLGILLVTEFARTTQAFAVEEVNEIVRLEWKHVLSAENSGGGLVTSIARLDGNAENTRLAQVLDVEQILRDVMPEQHASEVDANQVGRVQIPPGTVVLAHCDVDGAVTQGPCQIGPYARLRPGTVLAGGVHIGNFVETKQAQFGEGAKANHLAYLGDASIGARANIGAGTITCNYDGANKHRTEIGEDAFIGSNSALVAPVNIGRHATIGAGSVISKDAPADSLTLGRARQVTHAGWRRPRPKSS